MSAAWQDLLTRGPDESPSVWCARIASRLLNGARLYVGREPHRLVEVEAYYHSEDHPDPFAHRDPVQLHRGRWYFHRTRGTYRGGSFKGIDLAFGDGTAFAGMLFRGIEDSEGTLTDGPSLLVDLLLDKTGASTVAQLDKVIGERVAWDEDTPVRLEWLNEIADRPILTCARVGLSLKKAKAADRMPEYVLRSYRFLSEPRRTAKGKPHMVLALLASGSTPEEVTAQTGCPIGTVRRYAVAYEEGKLDPTVEAFLGAEMGTKELCKLHGVLRGPM